MTLQVVRKGEQPIFNHTDLFEHQLRSLSRRQRKKVRKATQRQKNADIRALAALGTA